MSEPRDPQKPTKDGGLQQPPQPLPSDAARTKGGAGEDRGERDAADIERDDSPGGRDGGMIGEG